MTPRKKPVKPEEKITEVNIASVDESIRDDTAAALEISSNRKEVLMGIIGAVATIAMVVQTISVTYMQAKTRDAVDKGTVEAREQTKAVADKLETTRDDHNVKLESIQKTSEETRDTSERTNVLVNSAALINLRLYVAALKRNVLLQTQANGSPDPGEVKELESAQKALVEHEEGQKVLDMRKRKE